MKAMYNSREEFEKKKYPEIDEVKKEHEDQFQEELNELFFLDEVTVNETKISINDTESKILEKFYEAETRKFENPAIKKFLSGSKEYTEFVDTKGKLHLYAAKLEDITDNTNYLHIYDVHCCNYENGQKCTLTIRNKQGRKVSTKGYAFNLTAIYLYKHPWYGGYIQEWAENN